MSWQRLVDGARQLAAEGRQRFEQSGVALLGTIRSDGSPRISPIEPYFLAGELVFGVMQSPKSDDLQRDPRCVIHSSVSDASGREGEFKVYGRVRAVADESILAEPAAWWSARPREGIAVYAMDVEAAALVAWDPDFGRMRTTSWAAGRGEHEMERTYP